MSIPAQDFPTRVYDALRGIAQKHLQKERPGHTLSATAIVHEAYLKLGDDRPREGDMARYYYAAAEAMRRVLIDHARKRHAEKRGGGCARAALSLSNLPDLDSPEETAGLLALEAALEQLERESPRAAEVVRLRFFAGLTIDQIAAAIGRAPRSVDRDWVFARAWLRRVLERAVE